MAHILMHASNACALPQPTMGCIVGFMKIVGTDITLGYPLACKSVYTCEWTNYIIYNSMKVYVLSSDLMVLLQL